MKLALGKLAASLSAVAFALCASSGFARAASQYPTMAPMQQYLMSSLQSEIALARSAAPAAISGKATVLVLGGSGYTTAVTGTNGFMCVVERSWANSTDDPGFWDPMLRAPVCFNAPATKTFASIYLMKSEMVARDKSKEDIGKAIALAFHRSELPAIAPGSMCYMMSQHQYLNEQGKHWHPHLMFLAPGNVAPSWGANLTDSPILASYDPQEHATVFMVVVRKWSDGTPGPPEMH